mgnify:CR=1 FL=1
MSQTTALFMVALSAGQTATAQRAAGRSQEALANYNAEIGMLRSEDALARGFETETRSRIGGRRLIGSQRAAFAASGVDISDPDSTAANVFADTAALSELDALTIRANAAREAWGYRMGAQNDQALGRIARQEGESRAVGTLLSTAGSVLYGKYGFAASSRTKTG